MDVCIPDWLTTTPHLNENLCIIAQQRIEIEFYFSHFSMLIKWISILHFKQTSTFPGVIWLLTSVLTLILFSISYHFGQSAKPVHILLNRVWRKLLSRLAQNSLFSILVFFSNTKEFGGIQVGYSYISLQEYLIFVTYSS